MQPETTVHQSLDQLGMNIHSYLEKEYLTGEELSDLRRTIATIARESHASLTNELQELDQSLAGMQEKVHLVDPDSRHNEISEKLRMIRDKWLQDGHLPKGPSKLASSITNAMWKPTPPKSSWRLPSFWDAREAVVSILTATSQTMTDTRLKVLRTVMSQQARFEMAKHDAEHDFIYLCNNIHKYGLTDPKMRAEVAKIVAGKEGDLINYRLENFEISDQDTLFEIAKIVAGRNGSVISQYIERYGILSVERRFDVAKIAVRQNPSMVSYFIKNYDLKDPWHLYQIACIGASAVTLSGVSAFIENYGIKDQRKLIHIAKLAAAVNCHDITENIKAYGIEDRSERFEIAKIAYTNDPDSLYHRKKLVDFDLNEREYNYIYFLVCCNNSEALSFSGEFYQSPELCNFLGNGNAKSNSISDLRGKFAQKWPGQFEKVFDQILQLDQKETKKIEEAKKWLLLTAICLHNDPPAAVDPDLWEAIYLHRDPLMRPQLSAHAAKICSGKNKYNNYRKLLSIEPQTGQPVRHLRLPLLYLCQRENSDDFKPLIIIIRKERSFREGPRLKVLIDTLQQLSEQNNQLSNQEIATLLTKAVDQQPKNQIRTNLYAIQGIIACGGLQRLKEALPLPNFDFDQIYQQVFREVIDVGELDNFAEKYGGTFACSSLPTSLLSYASRLKQLPLAERNKAFLCLGNFVRSVLNGSYSTDRYDVSRSPHLATLFRNNPGIEERWKVNKAEPFIRVEGTTSKNFSYKKFLFTKIVTDRHIPFREEYAYIRLFLIGNSHASELLNKKIASQKEAVNPQLLLQRDLIDLALAKPEECPQLVQKIIGSWDSFLNYTTTLKSSQ